jgi:hypothetical protein
VGQGRGEVNADSLSPLAKIQIARAVGVAIVVHGSLHPSMELLLRHSLQFLGLRGTKFVAETGVLDNRDGFLKDLTDGAWTTFEDESGSDMIAFESPMLQMSSDSEQQDHDTDLRTSQMKRRSMRKMRSSGLWAMVSGDESNDTEKLSPQDQVAVLSVHLMAFVLDGFLDPKELELWENVCEAVGASLDLPSL